MPSTRQRIPLRKRNLRNGALLAVSEAVKLVNIPIAQDFGRHLKQVAVALKPSVLQAPKINDSDAKDLAKHVEGILDVLNTAVQHLDHLGLSDANTNEHMLAELSRLQSQLSSTYIELQDIQTSQYRTKFASQAEIRERILHLKEDLSRTLVDLTLRLLVIALASGAQNQSVIVRRLDSTTRGHNALVRGQERIRRRQRISDKRIRVLTQEVNATQAHCHDHAEEPKHVSCPSIGQM